MYKKTLSICALSLISVVIYAKNTKHNANSSMISGIFEITSLSYDTSVTIGVVSYVNYQYQVTNLSNITQNNLVFTYPGATTADNSCVNGMSLDSGDSCDLDFRITLTTAGTMKVGERAGGSNAYPIKVCGFGGVGDDCSVPNQTDDVTTTIVYPAVGGGEEGSLSDPPYVIVSNTSHLDWKPYAITLSDDYNQGFTNALAYNSAWKQWYLVGGEWKLNSYAPNELIPPYNLSVPMISMSSDAVNWNPFEPSILLSDGFEHGKVSDLDIGSDGRVIAVGAEWNVDKYGSIIRAMPYAYSKLSLSAPWRVTKLPMSEDAVQGKIYDVDYENGLWVAVGSQWFRDQDDFLLHSEPLIDMSSDDGDHWAMQPVSDSYRGFRSDSGRITLRSVDYANGLWVSVGHQSLSNGPIIVTSPDGKHWTQQMIDNATGYDYGILRSVTNDHGEWVAIGREYGPVNDDILIMRSSDGLHWTRSFFSLPASYSFPNIYKIRVVGTKLIAAGNVIELIFGKRLPFLMQSSDQGLNWTSSIVPTTAKYDVGTLTSAE